MSATTAPAVESTPVHANMLKPGDTIATGDGTRLRTIATASTVSWTTRLTFTDGAEATHDGRELLALMDDRTRLPYRYLVVHSFHADRYYLHDGSNFVCWLDSEDDPAAIEQAWAAVDLHRQRSREYADAMAAGRVGAHAGCDHAYGICIG